MIQFKDFLQNARLYEDIFVKGDELLAAVNNDTSRRPSTPTSISTNLRPLGHQTGTTRGQDVWYAFSYKPSETSTELLKSFKGNGPFKFDKSRRDKFLNDATSHMAEQFKKMNKRPDVIVTPQSSSSLLSDFANMLADKLGIESKKIGAFKKSKPVVIDGDKAKALEAIKKKYIDFEYMEQVFKGDEQAKAHAADEIAKAIYRQIRDLGHIEVKKLHKATAKFVRNIMDSALEGEDEYSLMDKDVMVVDDVLSSGATMSDLFRACKDLLAKNVWGATLFARTSA